MTSLVEAEPPPRQHGRAGAVVLALTFLLMATALLVARLAPEGLSIIAVLAGTGTVVATVAQHVLAGGTGRRTRVRRQAGTRELAARLERWTDQLRADGTEPRVAAVEGIGDLADAWPGGRQRCVDVLCAFLRRPDEPRKVRLAAIRLIAQHLRTPGPTTWQGHDLDFTGATFDSGSFAGAAFPSGRISFAEATFQGQVAFGSAHFCGATVDFTGATFTNATVDFSYASFAGGIVDFHGARFDASHIDFFSAHFIGATLDFTEAVFDDHSPIRFTNTLLAGGALDLRDAQVTTGSLNLTRAQVSGTRIIGCPGLGQAAPLRTWRGRDRRRPEGPVAAAE